MLWPGTTDKARPLPDGAGVLRTPFQRIDKITLAAAFLREGRAVALPIRGRSMWPTLRHGDLAIVEPAALRELRRGDIALCIRGKRWFAHRVIGRKKEGPDWFVLTQGDTFESPDEPVSASHILGRIVAVERAGRRLDLIPSWARRLILVADRLRRFFDRSFLFGPPEKLLESVRAKFNRTEEVESYDLDASPEREAEELAWVRKILPDGGRILDIGCGPGIEAVIWAKAGFAVTAVDAAPEMLRRARQRADRAGVKVEFHDQAANETAFPANSFDLVYFGAGVYSYIPTRGLRIEALRRARRSLGAGGRIALCAFTGGLPSRLSGSGLTFLARRMMEKVLRTGSQAEWGDLWAWQASPASDPSIYFVHIFPTEAHFESELGEAGLIPMEHCGTWLCRPAGEEPAAPFPMTFRKVLSHPASWKGRAPPDAVLMTNLKLFLELEELLKALPGTKLMLLKGGALIAAGHRSVRDRHLEDLDLLVRHEDWDAVTGAMQRLGFQKWPKDPCHFRKGRMNFDLHTHVWYLNDREEQAWWDEARTVAVGDQECWAPAPEDHLIYLLAHAAIHQGERKPKWIRDVRLLLENSPSEIDIPTLWLRLEALGLKTPVRWFVLRGGLDELAEIPGKLRDSIMKAGEVRRFGAWGLFAGRILDRPRSEPIVHLLRFLFLRNRVFQMKYAFRALFPEASFIARRYDLSRGWQVGLWRLLRPLLIAWGLFEVLWKSPDSTRSQQHRY